MIKYKGGFRMIENIKIPFLREAKNFLSRENVYALAEGFARQVNIHIMKMDIKVFFEEGNVKINNEDFTLYIDDYYIALFSKVQKKTYYIYISYYHAQESLLDSREQFKRNNCSIYSSEERRFYSKKIKEMKNNDVGFLTSDKVLFEFFNEKNNY